MKESVRKKLVWWVIGFNFTLGIIMGSYLYDSYDPLGLDQDLSPEYYRLQHYNELIDQGYNPDLAKTTTNSWWDTDPFSRLVSPHNNYKANLAMVLDPTGRTSIEDPAVAKLKDIDQAISRDYFIGGKKGIFGQEQIRQNIHRYLLDRYEKDKNFRDHIQLINANLNNKELKQKFNTLLTSEDTLQDYNDWQNHKGRYAPPSQSINPDDANAIGQSVLADQEVKPSTGNPFDDLRTEVQDKAQRDVMARRDEMKRNAYTNLQAQLDGLDPDKQLEMINITERNLNAELAKIKGTPEWEAATRERQKQLEKDRAIVKGIAYRNRVQRTAAEADRKAAEYQKSIAPTPLHRGTADKPVVIRKPGEKWSFMGY